MIKINKTLNNIKETVLNSDKYFVSQEGAQNGKLS